MRLAVRFSPTRGINAGSQNTVAQCLVPALLRINPDIIVFTAAPEYFQQINNVTLAPTRGFYSKNLLAVLVERLLDQVTFEKELLRYNCDAVYYPYTHECIIYSRSVPQVITVHDLIPMVYPEMFPSMSKQWKYFTIPALRRAARVITDARYTLSDIDRYIPGLLPRVRVVPLGFRPKRVMAGNSQHGNVFGKYLLYVSSSIYPYKNIERLCAAFAKLPQSTCNLVVVGKRVPRFAADLKAVVDRSPARNRIVFLEDVGAGVLEGLYANAELFVYPSLYEGFGIPPLEAMSYGVPVAASSATTISEVCGDAAHYFDPESESDMMSAISRCLADGELRKELISRGHKRHRRFSWDSTAAKILEVCREALGSR